MADGGNVIAKAYVAIIPTMAESQKSIATQLTGVTEPASKEAGEKSGKNFGESMAKGLKTAGKVITGAFTAITATAVASSKAFVNTAKNVADLGDTIDKQSQKTGLSAKTWQEFDYVMKIAGTDMSSMTAGMKTLTNQVDLAKKGNDEAIDRFKKLGISMKDLKTMSREDLFKKTISSLQGMKESTTRASLANKLFGKSGQDLNPLLNMTAKETQELINKANDLGMVMSDQGVKASATFKDSLTTLGGTLQGVKNNIMTQFLPGLTAITDGLTDVFAGKGARQLSQGISLLMVELKRIAPDVLSAVTAVGTSVIQGLGPLLPNLVTTIFTLLTTAITTISSMIPQLMPSIISGIQGAMSALMTALPIIIDGVSQLVMSLVKWLSSGSNVQEMVGGIMALVTKMVNSFSEILPILLPAITTIVTEVCKALTDPDTLELLIDALLALVGSIAVTLVKDCLPILAKAVVSIIKNLAELLARFFEWTVPIVVKGIEGIVNTVKSWGTTLGNNIKNWISDTLGKIGAFAGEVITKLKDLPKQGLQIAKDLILGFINGVNSMAKKAIDTVKGLGSKVVSGLKGILGIHSPSKVFKELGEMTGEGFRIGYEDSFADAKDDIMSSMEGLTGNMTATVNANSTATPMNGSTTVNGGSITINVYGSEGQNINDLANVIAYKLEEMTKRKGAVYA